MITTKGAAQRERSFLHRGKMSRASFRTLDMYADRMVAVKMGMKRRCFIKTYIWKPFVRRWVLSCYFSPIFSSQRARIPRFEKNRAAYVFSYLLLIFADLKEQIETDDCDV